HLSHLLLETDAPYLTPVPFRGKRNEPAYLTYVTNRLSEIIGVSVDEVENITTANALKLFF
ncbi:MAG: TatD family hydrolase, partial [Chitinophagales bacterium]